MLAEHLGMHDLYPDDRVAVQGRVTVSPQLPPSRLAPLHLDRAFHAIGDRRELDWRSFFTCNVSVKRSLLDRGGLFEESIRYHEDLELSERLSHHGLRVIYNPAALGYHEHFLTESEFLAIARREAKALLVWACKAPQLAPMLAEYGFEPTMSANTKLKGVIRNAVFNRVTIPFWCAIARSRPDFLESFGLRIYLQIYQSVKRACLREEMRRERQASNPAWQIRGV
jgi:hypothetical protein